MRDVYSSASHGDIGCLVEIAVVETAVPGDGYEGPAHEAGYGAGIETGDKSVHVRLFVSGLDEPVPEPAKRHVPKGVKIGENDSPVLFEIAAEFPLELVL